MRTIASLVAALVFGVGIITGITVERVTEPPAPTYSVETIDITEYIQFRNGQQVECVIITTGDFAMAGPCVTSY